MIPVENVDDVYLEHEQDGIEDDEGHDEVLKGRRLDQPPQLILVTIPLLNREERKAVLVFQF